MDRIYLDHNATSPTDPRVAETLCEALRSPYANPASQHEEGRRARRVIDRAAIELARHFGADIETSGARLIFTSGGTEANNLALLGLCGPPPARLIVSSIEHPSVLEAAAELSGRGYQVDLLPVDRRGVVRLERLESLLAQPARLVSIMLANHETGAIQPVAEAAEICRQHGVLLHTDAVQAAGKLPVDFHQLGVAALSLSAHKLGGPVGIGALLLAAGTNIKPLLFGGSQQLGIRPGTEPVALALGMQQTYDIWLAEGERTSQRLRSLRDHFESQLQAALPNIVVHSSATPRLPHVSCVSFPGADRQALHLALDMAGVACSTGSACQSGSSRASHVLRAMGLEPSLWDSALRFSLGPRTTPAELDEAVQRIVGCYNNLRVRITP